VNGFLAGLVAITCPCYWVSPTGAFLLGAIAGVICVISIDLFEYLRIDDPVGAVSVHGVCGVWGTLSLGLFATGQFGAPGPYGADTSPGALVTGLFYGGGVTQLVAQAVGSTAITSGTFLTSLLMMYALSAVGVLRLAPEKERLGMDVTEHGGPAYPELVPRDEADPRRDLLIT
jgi:Amt family ammonium transporter